MPRCESQKIGRSVSAIRPNGRYGNIDVRADASLGLYVGGSDDLALAEAGAFPRARRVGRLLNCEPPNRTKPDAACRRRPQQL